MLLGIGIALVEVPRLEALLARGGRRLEARIFTGAERAYCRARSGAASHFAARLAAKQAALRALGSPAGARWLDAEVESDGGTPRLKFTGVAAASAARLRAIRPLLSLSHAGDTAIATVLLEADRLDRPTGRSRLRS